MLSLRLWPTGAYLILSLYICHHLKGLFPPWNWPSMCVFALEAIIITLNNGLNKVSTIWILLKQKHSLVVTWGKMICILNSMFYIVKNMCLRIILNHKLKWTNWKISNQMTQNFHQTMNVLKHSKRIQRHNFILNMYWIYCFCLHYTMPWENVLKESQKNICYEFI